MMLQRQQANQALAEEFPGTAFRIETNVNK